MAPYGRSVVLYAALVAAVSGEAPSGEGSTAAASNPLSFVNAAERLVAELLNRTLVTSVRPALSGTSAVTVEVTLPYVGVVDINEKEGEMTSTIYPSLKWRDPRLTWLPANHFNITELPLPASSVWIPDVEVYNRYEDASSDEFALRSVIVTSNGSVMYVPKWHVRTVCHFNLVKFPFDRQQCEVVLGSWGYDITKIDLTTVPLAYSAFNVFELTREWDFENVTITRATEIRPDLDDATFPTIRLAFTITRRASYFYRLFVAPGAIVMFSLPVVHFSPAGSSEKLTLCGSMLIGVTIMFSMLEEFFPAHSVDEIPIILHYYSSALFLLYVSMIMACVSASLANPGTKTSRVPPLLRKIFIEKLGYLCCVSGRASKFDYQLLHLERYIINSVGNHVDTGLSDHHDEEDEAGATAAGDETSAIVDGRSRQSAGRARPGAGSDGNGGETAVKVVQALVTEMQYSRFALVCRLEWQQLSMALDRVTGFLFFILAIVVTAATVNKAI